MRQTSQPMRFLVQVIMLAVVFVPLVSCLKPKSETCASGLVCPPGMHCTADQNGCTMSTCGDGKVQVEQGEVCDDGNLRDNDGCSRDCQSDERCGNHIVDAVRGEMCDDGNNESGDGCSADCRTNERCGNGIVDAVSGEKCDDGSNVSGDGCSANCLSDESCGNGIVDIVKGETCDDGNMIDGDACNSNCRAGPLCTNGILNAGEECDDGNTSNDDNCPNTCEMVRCGDGFVDAQLPRIEQCDSGGESATCNINCTPRRCGDGIVNQTAGEQCDHYVPDNMPPLSTQTCDADCSIAICGDGYLNEAAGEACDLGGQKCGACSETCVWHVGHATGTVEVVPGSDLLDGETLTVSNGRDTVIFEFNKAGSFRSWHVPIGVTNHDTAWDVALSLRDEIRRTLGLEVSIDDGRVLRLRSNEAGSVANRAILEDVNSPRFRVAGMTGGAGYDCSEGSRCQSEHDCESHLACNGGFCARRFIH